MDLSSGRWKGSPCGTTGAASSLRSLEPAKGGIRAQSKKGQFGQSWWAKRWIAVLEGFDIGARLGRGRSYARNGQVLEINIGKGLVRAKVQGSRPKPYEITIQARTIAPGDWEKLAKALASQAIFAAKLLAGEMPRDIEKAFEGAGLSLFPAQLGDLQTKCSCPDWSNPCKHIAAVYYLLGEEFDRDPFLIFALRGLARDEFLALLGRSGAVAVPSGRGRPEPARAALERPGHLLGRVERARGGPRRGRAGTGRRRSPPPKAGRLPVLEGRRTVPPGHRAHLHPGHLSRARHRPRPGPRCRDTRGGEGREEHPEEATAGLNPSLEQGPRVAPRMDGSGQVGPDGVGVPPGPTLEVRATRSVARLRSPCLSRDGSDRPSRG